jgi:hypothetical protein
MKHIELETIPTFYQKYVATVQHLELKEALIDSNNKMMECLKSIDGLKENYAYAPGKWTVKELLCHIIDAERIFTYRALRFSRSDQTPLHGFDENKYVPESNASSRSLDSIREELVNLRRSTIDFFVHCNDTMLNRKGSANGTEISVKALGYVVAGHAMHHLNILKERYLQ